MPLPDRITLVRHGESEANIAQRLVKRGREAELPETFNTRHDSFMRLSREGVEQARITGEFLKQLNSEENYLFDRWYVSPHIRTRETAASMNMNGEWLVDSRFRERDWGEIASHIGMDEKQKFVKDLHEYYWCPPGGESLASGVRSRVESIMNTLYRRDGLRHVLAVTHGEFIRMFQTVSERLTPEAFIEIDKAKGYKIENAMVIQYSSVNPHAPEERKSHYEWRRAICPWDRSFDWDGGEWVHVPASKQTDAQLMEEVTKHERLIPDYENTSAIPLF